tara:strand:+ start:64 stop:372 length:309 start_codon:yes stop_codon:yes gene_type:complete
MNEDIFGFATGTTDGSGVVDMGDGVFIPTRDFKTVRLPEQHGGHWVAVIDSAEIGTPTPHGWKRDGTVYLLAADVSVISLDIGTQSWVATKQIESFFANEEE